MTSDPTTAKHLTRFFTLIELLEIAARSGRKGVASNTVMDPCTKCRSERRPRESPPGQYPTLQRLVRHATATTIGAEPFVVRRQRKAPPGEAHRMALSIRGSAATALEPSAPGRAARVSPSS